MMTEDVEKAGSDATLPARRRADILRLAQQLGQITVTDMSARFDVSLDTIRRDLDILAEQGLVSRIHGGALPSSSMATADTPFDLRMKSHHAAKTRIGQAAAELIADGETLLVNGGTTTLAFAAALEMRRRLTIVTNNLGLPPVVPPAAILNLYLLGGEIRTGAQVTVGPVGFVGTGAIAADTAVIGVGGVDATGFWTSHLSEATMMAAMIEAARRTIVLADSRKFGRHAFAKVASLERVFALVTDTPPPSDIQAALEAAGTLLIVAPDDGEADAG
ncbi:transcriptional regulator [Pleomorphomonas diazotrophica]|uniref:Transcriptional regulator n=2 Tax=Pleomorphomonas diazotrophica TaxID=1166257 RepID=A0A1I4TP24_9HYPH|nr:transcriptional regulator [Pleomorphomonas diazotrophica]SFM78544.1 transcriptional regulator, DeoR family [Pleomorphomonas diazotrophica]